MDRSSATGWGILQTQHNAADNINSTLQSNINNNIHNYHQSRYPNSTINTVTTKPPLIQQYSAEGHVILCLRRLHQQRHQSEERTGRRFRPSRRSKSEGPPTRDFPFQSEYRLQYGKLLAERQANQDQLPNAPGVNSVKSEDWDEEMVDKGEEKKEVPRSRKEFLIRHHLERTTGAVDGALLPSPTREKLEPVIPRRKDEDINMKSPSKSSPKSSPRSARSQSVGPISENRSSPKRQPRTPSAAPTSTHSSIAASVGAAGAKTHTNGPIHAERRPRPTSLSTAPSRPKSSSVAMRNEEGKSHHAMKPKHNLPAASTGKSVVNGTQNSNKLKGDRTKAVSEKKDPSGDAIDSSTTSQQQDPPVVHTQKPTPTSGASQADEEKAADADFSPAHPMSQDQSSAYIEDSEPLVKSPPEPTRVKSPEQILMRSPEPVNWTVPLDTGKTFTVTQNVREAVPTVKLARGELSRPHSEAKQWSVTPMEHESIGKELGDSGEGNDPDRVAGWKSPSSDPMTTSMMGSFSTVNGLEDKSEDSQASQEIKPPPPEPSSSSKQPVAAVSFEKAVAGTTLKCLDDPTYDFSSPSLSGVKAAPTHKPEPSSAYHVLEAPSDVYGGDPCGGIPRPASTPYRILEAPDVPPNVSPTKSAPLMSPSSSRSLASDVLEKARTRFDKFWGKSKDSDKEGNV